MFLFDTNMVSELRRPEFANPGALQWAMSVSADAVFVSAVTLLELERGVVLAEKGRPAQGAALRHWMTANIIPSHAARALPITAEIALRAATFADRHDDDVADHMIAATALVHGLTLITRNVRHFERTGVRLLNPFT